MTTPRLTEDQLAVWAEPDLQHLTADDQAEYFNRKAAFWAIAKGKSIFAAADDHGLDRGTLTKAVRDSIELAPDGRSWGWRACIPRRVRSSSSTKEPELPAQAGPSAFSKLMRAIVELPPLLASFTKALPTRERRSPAFENFFDKFLATVRGYTNGQGYPFNAADKGRRSVIEHIKRLRRELPTENEDAQAERMHARQLKEVFEFGVMERLEFDAHKMDADFCLEVEDGNGKVVLRRISYVWLIVLIDSVSRLVLGWSLVLGRAYSQIDVLRVFSRALVPWEPRDLLAPGMAYVPGSGIGTAPAIGLLQRGILLAADNALAHHSKLTTSNLTRYQRGVLHLGTAYVPETRGILEAFFRQVENGAIRRLPGGFEPQRDADTPKRATTNATAQQHPLNPIALQDLLDVVIAGFNATPLATLGNQSPLDVVRRDAAERWSFATSCDADDAHELSRIPIRVTIKGNRKEHRQPYVNYLRARYRSFGLRDKWKYVGETYAAWVSMEDLRYIHVLNEKGELLVRLIALPPWSRTRHDYDLRQLIVRLSNRKLFSIAGADDAIEAFRKYCRKNVESTPAVIDQMGKHWSQFGASSVTKAPAKQQNFVPRGGGVNFDHVKDPIK